MKTTATVSHKSWKEDAYQQTSETEKLTRVSSEQTYKGDWEGDSQLDYLMAYTPAGPVYYVGLERFEGTLGGKKGSFVLQHIGAYKDNEAQTTFEVVPGSGTGELTGLTGKGGYRAGHQESWPADLSYELLVIS